MEFKKGGGIGNYGLGPAFMNADFSDTIMLHGMKKYIEETPVGTITVEVDIEHGRLTARQPDLLPETGIGLLTVLSPGNDGPSSRVRVSLPLVRCLPGTLVSPTAEDLDDSLWD